MSNGQGKVVLETDEKETGANTGFGEWMLFPIG